MSDQAMYSILIVDDNKNNLFTLRTLLQAHLDTEVIEAESGVIALEKISQYKIDLILLDIQMPQMDGFEVAALIRSRKKYRDIPIIFLTAVFKSDDFKEKGLIGGAIDYLTKPIDDDVLINRVKAYLRLIEGERAMNRRLKDINEQLQAEIEERKRAEKALARERALLTSLVNSIPDIIFYKDLEGTYLGCNPAFTELVGRSPQEIIGLNDFELFPDHLAEMFRENDALMLQHGQPRSNEEWLEYPDGRRVPVDMLKTPYWGPDDKIMGLIGIARDITERKHAEEELQRLNQELKQASQHKSNFLSNMSHEIRTPLNAMIGYLSLTLTSLTRELPEERLENLVKAEHSARVLLQVINDVLDFSKIEAGKMDILIEEVDLVDIIEDVAITAEGLLLGKPVELLTELDPELPYVESDFTKIKQMLNNLVGNAIKFTTAGNVSIRARQLEPHTAPNTKAIEVVRLEVQDTGAGIPREKLANVFESFEQVDSSIKRKFGGTGLGLTITKSFCDMLGIEIGVESDVDEGTMFWLHIPVEFYSEDIKNAQEMPIHPETSPARSSEELSSEAAEQLGTFQSILVVDDDEMNLELLVDVFDSSGHQVYRALSGAEAVQLTQKEHPDVILMDLAMPDMDGFETTQSLKHDPATAQTLIIACSALATEDIREQAFKAGCDGFIRKPIKPDQLMKQVADAVRHAHQRLANTAS